MKWFLNIFRRKPTGFKPGLPPPAVEWTDAHRATFAAFLRSATGQALLNNFLAHVAGHNEWATRQDKFSAERGNGQAQGFTYAYQFLISLAAAHSGKSEHSADTNGTAGPLDHLRP